MKTKKKSKKPTKKEKKQLIQKAGIAMKNQFFMEATWLLSEILEKKLKYLLEVIENSKPGAGFTLEQCIKRLKHLHVANKNQILKNHFDLKLIEKTMTWKNQRNTMIKDMLYVHVSKQRKENLALDGVKLLKEWNKAVKIFKVRQSEQVPASTEEIPPQ